MLSTQSYCEIGNYTLVGGSTSTNGVQEDRKTKAIKNKHSEAEKRRRKRINGHLDTLRTLLPNTVKTDKASLLTEVVRHLRELKRTTDHLSSNTTNPNDETEISQFSMIPSETDQFQLRHNKTESGLVVRATLCCDDRPELIADVAQAVRAAGGKAVKAEMVTVGGRTKVVLWAQCDCDEEMGKLGRGLKVVLNNVVFSGHKKQCHSHDV